MDDLPEFVRGMISVLEHMPGVALLADQQGRVVYANQAYYSDLAQDSEERDTHGMASEVDRIPKVIMMDAFGTDQGNYHSLTLPSGRLTGVACRRVSSGQNEAKYLLMREDSRQSVVSKFTAAQDGLLRAHEDRDLVWAEQKRLRAEADRWRLLSMSDRLTGLYNATGFRDRATSALDAHEFGALVYADLNGFKSVNDTLGHNAGDSLLQEIGQSVQEVIRGADLAGRIGGDEFAIFLPNCPAAELSKVVTRLRKAMTRRIPVSMGAGKTAMILSVTPAIGSAVFPEDHSGLDDLLRLADARMYADKAGDRLRRGQARA
jgi:diguanylate cyclase (GGDEF)-like protein